MEVVRPHTEWEEDDRTLPRLQEHLHIHWVPRETCYSEMQTRDGMEVALDSTLQALAECLC